jgi:hypothetical protein
VNESVVDQDDHAADSECADYSAFRAPRYARRALDQSPEGRCVDLGLIVDVNDERVHASQRDWNIDPRPVAIGFQVVAACRGFQAKLRFQFALSNVPDGTRK